METEVKFFRNVAIKCVDHVSKSLASNTISRLKGGSTVDVATAVDESVEQLIVSEIKKYFPTDDILAEEAYSETKITDTRIWVIDPICGTTNLSRGVITYCTNIALVDNGQIVAACVVDYSRSEFIWSVGDGVFLGEEKFTYTKQGSGVLAYVDLGCLHQAAPEDRNSFNKIVAELSGEEGWMLGSFNTSLGNMYVASGRIDVAVNYIFKPWDVCASIFLVRQMGGFAVDYNGNDWKIGDDRLILCMDPEIMQKVVAATKSA